MESYLSKIPFVFSEKFELSKFDPREESREISESLSESGVSHEENARIDDRVQHCEAVAEPPEICR